MAMDGTCETERSETSMAAPIARLCKDLSSSSRLERSPSSKLITVLGLQRFFQGDSAGNGIPPYFPFQRRSSTLKFKTVADK